MNLLIRLLRCPIVWTADEERARRSSAQWAKQEAYSLSLLGMINGILPRLIGRVLVVKVDNESGRGRGFMLRQPWW